MQLCQVLNEDQRRERFASSRQRKRPLEQGAETGTSAVQEAAVDMSAPSIQGAQMEPPRETNNLDEPPSSPHLQLSSTQILTRYLNSKARSPVPTPRPPDQAMPPLLPMTHHRLPTNLHDLRHNLYIQQVVQQARLLGPQYPNYLSTQLSGPGPPQYPPIRPSLPTTQYSLSYTSCSSTLTSGFAGSQCAPFRFSQQQIEQCQFSSDESSIGKLSPYPHTAQSSDSPSPKANQRPSVITKNTKKQQTILTDTFDEVPEKTAISGHETNELKIDEDNADANMIMQYIHKKFSKGCVQFKI
jgi:hypothetical protein